MSLSPRRTLLIQLDGSLPNLALMRLAAWRRLVGDDEVVLRHAPKLASVERHIGDDSFSRVYASAFFERSRGVADAVRLMKERWAT